MGYITNFIVYTLAMVGVIVVALLVCKNATSFGGSKTSKFLKIIDSISIGQRKNLFIVSTGKEQFLVAGDVNTTCLISKIEPVSNNDSFSNILDYTKTSIETSNDNVTKTEPRFGYMDKSNIGVYSGLSNKKSSNSVIRNLAEIMRNK